MGSYKNILVAYDGSDSSGNALKLAVRLANAGGGTVKAVNVMLSSEELGVDVLGHGVLKESAEKLLKGAESIAWEEKGKIIPEVLQGSPPEAIATKGEEDGCDLIVVGRRGLTRIERMLMGSVTSRLLARTDRDVLVVPVGAGVDFTKVLVATDGSDYGDAAVNAGAEFAKSYGGSLDVVAAVEVDRELFAQAPDIHEQIEKNLKEALERSAKKAESLGVKAQTHMEEGRAHEEIVELAGKIKAGLIIMGSHGRRGIKKMLMGSVTEKVIGLASSPVLVVRKA